MPEETEGAAELAMELIEKEREKEPWFDHAALSSMIMAMVMAVGALLAGMSANEALVDRQKQIADLVLESQAAMEVELLTNRILIQGVTGQTPDQALSERILGYAKEEADLLEQAETDAAESEETLYIHERLAIGVALIALAVTLTGMAIIVNTRRLWYVSLGFGAFGTAMVGWGAASFLSG